MKTLAALALLAFTMIPAHASAQTSAPAKTAGVSGKWNATMTRMAPDGRTQSIPFVFDLTQKGEELTGTISPDADRVWPIEKGGTVKAGKLTFQVQQPNGPLRKFDLALVKDTLEGDMNLEFNGQTANVKVVAERAK